MRRFIQTYFFLIVATLSIAQTPAYQHDSLKTVADLGKSMAIGLSVNSANRVFVSFPNSDGNGNLALAEIKDGKLAAYPDTDWNTRGSYDSHFLRVQDLYVDASDNLWVLDSKPAPSSNIFGGGQQGEEGKFKLVKINTETHQVEKVYLFEDLDKSKSALNDVRIDVEKGLAYLSDPGLAAIVVLDLKTGKSRALLQHTPFTLADDIVLKYDGVEMKDKDGNPFSSHINGIALTSDFNYFYFKPINKENLFRIETRYLADVNLSSEELEAKVEVVAKVGVTHGLIADKKGNIYLTTSESFSISYVSPDGKLRRLVQDSRLLWPDSFGIGSDGYLYFTCAQLQRLPQWNNGVDKTEYPYRAYRVKLIP